MAAGVPHLRGLQQYHEKEQSPLRHDRGSSTEAQKAKEEKLKNRRRGSIFRVGKCSPCIIRNNHCPFSWSLHGIVDSCISSYDVANLQVYFEYLPPFIITNLYFITSTQCKARLSNYHSNILTIFVSKLLECLLARYSFLLHRNL